MIGGRITERRLRPRLASIASLQILVATVLSAQSIMVGPNVWVSSSMPGAGHYEVTLATDPGDPMLLLAGTMIWRAERGIFQTAAYASRDGGESWKQTLYIDQGMDSQDPAVAYGPNHAAYFVSWGNDTSWTIRTLVAASPDGGATWKPSAEIITLDREFISVDNTMGKYRGRIYVNGQDNDRLYDSDSSVSSAWILRFDSLQRPLEPKHYIANGNREITIPTNGIVTADGSYITGFIEHDNPVGSPADSVLTKPNATLKMMRSVDGGSRFEKATIIARMYDRFGELNVSSIPWLAADVSNASRLRGRLYAVWADRRRGRSEIWLARSEDGGDHWSAAVRVNDDEARSDGKGPDDFHPLVAVNRAGVIGVMWYDRRDNADNTGWWVRFTASVDGGETFSPSVRVSEAALDIARDTAPVISAMTRGGGHPHPLLAGGPLRTDIVYSHFNFVGGHTAGLASSADGLFHPSWVDNRTGVSQVYTTTIRVLDGKATQRDARGASGTNRRAGRAQSASTTAVPRDVHAALQDISRAVTLELSHVSYHEYDSLVTASAVLRNTSRDTLFGPFELRISSLKSDLGDIYAIDATSTTRATPVRSIELASSDVRPLAPGGSLSLKRLTFRLAHPPHRIVPTASTSRLVGYGVTLVSLESEVLGRYTPACAAHR
jgi:hypothetical protein